MRKPFNEYPSTVRIFMLQALSGKGNVLNLKKAGYSYVQILSILESAKAAELVTMVDGKLAITPAGSLTLRELIAQQPLKTARTWLVEQPADRIDALNEDDVYVPPLKDIL